jgi:YD repeat-containing protein
MPFVTTDHYYYTYNSTLTQSETPGLPYFYSKVTEDTGSDTVNVSRSVYYFACLEQGGNNLGVEPAEELHYKKTSGGYSLLSSKFYDYETRIDTILFGVKPYVTISELDGPGGAAINTYSADVYTLFSEWKNLAGTTETIYNNDTLTTKTRNQYSLATHNLALVQQTGSDGRTTTQKLKYPEDYTPGITGNLVAANVVGPVIEKQIWQKRSATDSILIGGTVTKYDSLMYKPVKIYALESTAGLSAPNSETKTSGKYNTLLSDNNYKQRVTYYYDTDAKITAQQLTGGITVAYQYGYPAASGLDAGENNYPIAECRNAAVTEFYTQNFEDNTSFTSGAAHTGKRYYSGSSYTVSWTRPNSRAYVISYWYKSGTSWQYSGEVAYTGSSYTLSGGTAYDDIRIYPADAQLSTYTYLPGIGVSSTIDAKGITSYYEYDLQNRLACIKDQYGNILKYNNYNYAH